MGAKENCELANAYADRKLWVLDEWGAKIARLFPVTTPEICNPRNPLYEPNHPANYYTESFAMQTKSRAARRANSANFDAEAKAKLF
jgi:hypothetical protein